MLRMTMMRGIKRVAQEIMEAEALRAAEEEAEKGGEGGRASQATRASIFQPKIGTDSDDSEDYEDPDGFNGNTKELQLEVQSLRSLGHSFEACRKEVDHSAFRHHFPIHIKVLNESTSFVYDRVEASGC